MIEYIAVIFGILSVWYAQKNKVLVFPTGIISVLIYVYLTYENKLYADTGINIYYFIMSVYGWVFLIIQYALNKTDSDVVFLDSITTALSLTGMLLLARRKLENWIYWIIADIIYIPLYIHKELYPTSLQFFIFLFLAILGYRNWKKELKK